MKNQIHYIVPGRDKQPIELMRLGLTDAEFDGYCIGNVLKYILRCKHKGGINDLYKAREYIDFLIRSLNHDPILGDEGYWATVRNRGIESNDSSDKNMIIVREGRLYLRDITIDMKGVC